MGDAGSPQLPFIDADEDVPRCAALLEAVAGLLSRTSPHQTATATVAEFDRLVMLVMRLKQRMEALEAELVPSHRSRKCPGCHQLSLVVVAARPHPEFGAEGIEEHDVRCGCGYQACRLYDPRDFIR